jgi:hypothetical protein
VVSVLKVREMDTFVSSFPGSAGPQEKEPPNRSF